MRYEDASLVRVVDYRLQGSVVRVPALPTFSQSEESRQFSVILSVGIK